MIGLIVTGHGNFGTGLTSSLHLIGGEQDAYVAIDFTQEMSVEDLEKRLQEAYSTLAECDGILVLSDLAGGSPFKTAVLTAMGSEKVQVIGGTNLPMLIEVSMARRFVEDLSTLVEMALNTGKSQVVKFENIVTEYVESEDGI
ncbi:MAG: PTS galactosamine/N-acetylgalactosamine transporter subunit IIA [Erysipelotrichaceae bacterium]